MSIVRRLILQGAWMLLHWPIHQNGTEASCTWREPWGIITWLGARCRPAQHAHPSLIMPLTTHPPDWVLYIFRHLEQEPSPTPAGPGSLIHNGHGSACPPLLKMTSGPSPYLLCPECGQRDHACWCSWLSSPPGVLWTSLCQICPWGHLDKPANSQRCSGLGARPAFG